MVILCLSVSLHMAWKYVIDVRRVQYFANMTSLSVGFCPIIMSCMLLNHVSHSRTVSDCWPAVYDAIAERDILLWKLHIRCLICRVKIVLLSCLLLVWYLQKPLWWKLKAITLICWQEISHICAVLSGLGPWCSASVTPTKMGLILASYLVFACWHGAAMFFWCSNITAVV